MACGMPSLRKSCRCSKRKIEARQAQACLAFFCGIGNLNGYRQNIAHEYPDEDQNAAASKNIIYIPRLEGSTP